MSEFEDLICDACEKIIGSFDGYMNASIVCNDCVSEDGVYIIHKEKKNE